MLAAGGVHPYVLRRRRNALFRAKAKGNGLGPSLVLVMLFLAGFACGLRWIDQRFTPTPYSSTPSPARELDSSFSEQLSENIRFIFGVNTAQAAEFDSTQSAKQATVVTVQLNGAEHQAIGAGILTKVPIGRAVAGDFYDAMPRYYY